MTIQLPPYVPRRSNAVAQRIQNQRHLYEGSIVALEKVIADAEEAFIAILDEQERREQNRDRINALTAKHTQRVPRG